MAKVFPDVTEPEISAMSGLKCLTFLVLKRPKEGSLIITGFQRGRPRNPVETRSCRWRRVLGRRVRASWLLHDQLRRKKQTCQQRTQSTKASRSQDDMSDGLAWIRHTRGCLILPKCQDNGCNGFGSIIGPASVRVG